MFAACNSGGGKTTITCAVLRALKQRGLNPAAFKCGPDYIDPMFHSEVVGVKSRNLDLFMLSEKVCRYLLAKNSADAQIAILEGVMGYYDGLGGSTIVASSYHLAAVTNTPVILVVDCRGSSLSLAALIKGFMEFRPDSDIKGVILNNLAAKLYPVYKEMIEREAAVKVVGYFPRLNECTLGSRHLGLITASEVRDLQAKIDILAGQAQNTIDMDMLLTIAQQAPDIEYQEYPIAQRADITVAVAKDSAFCFYYQDSLELLERMGAKIQYFSPLVDTTLPECDGLILGGGYPELYAEQLAKNTAMRQSIKRALDHGLPCIAECGGFMYLQQSLTDQQGNGYSMVGSLPGEARMTTKLNRFGYVTLVAQEDNLLCRRGEKINAHEFHYADSSANGSSFQAVKPVGGRQWACVQAAENLYAGYPHLHLWGNMDFAASFIDKCQEFQLRVQKESTRRE
jgi:cobyrinic acid a,c-diamide synthase